MKKQFDCIAMKESIQQQLYHKQKGMSEAEVKFATQKNLEHSQSAVAKLWRSVQKFEKEKFKKAV